MFTGASESMISRQLRDSDSKLTFSSTRAAVGHLARRCAIHLAMSSSVSRRMDVPGMGGAGLHYSESRFNKPAMHTRCFDSERSDIPCFLDSRLFLLTPLDVTGFKDQMPILLV